MDRSSPARRTSRRALRLAIVFTMLVALVPLVAAPASAATTYYVDPGGSNSAAGTSEATAWKTITYAMTQVSAGDTVIALPGTYSPASGESVAPLALVAGVTLRSKNGAAQTTIDMGDAGLRYISMRNPTQGSAFRGFTVTGGNTSGGGFGISSDGGGAAPAPGWPRIEDSVFHGNSGGGGGAISMSASTFDLEPLIEGNVFRDNDASNGAGIYTSGFGGAEAKPVIRDNDFIDNEASSDGGGVYCGPGSQPVFDGNHFTGNEGTGGAIRLGNGAGAQTLIVDCEIVSNTTSEDGAGIMMNDAGTVTIERTRIVDNIAPDDAGGVDVRQNTVLAIVNSVIAGNECEDEGGAVRAVTNAEVDIVNSTIYGNRQVDGGNTGISNFPGVADLTSSGPGADVINSVFWGQTDQEDVVGCAIRYSITEQTDLASIGNTVGTGVIHTDPMFFDAANDDFRLLIGSPAIDAAAAAAAPADDIDGTTRPQDGDGDGTAADDMGAWERPGLEISRYSGLDRYETAALIATGNFTDADVAILASGENFPDALAAAGLAGSYEAPLLLTRTASLPSYTSDALSDLGVTDIVIVGGSGAVSDAVANALDADYDVSRIWGPTRYETAAEVAGEIADMEGPSFAKRAFLARGDEYPDALAISPFAYDSKVPILLTYTDLLAPATADALDELDIEGGVVTGGEGAVSAAVKSGVDAITTGNGGAATVRYGGIDRYETAAIIAEDGVDAGYGSWDYVGLATGLNFPDALAGGVAAGANRGVILLTRTDVLPSFTADALADHGAEILFAEVYGGPGAVAPAVEDDIWDAMGW